MPINFPNTPATNDVYLAPNGIEYIYTGSKWTPFKPVEPTIGAITASSQLDLSAGGTNQNVVISPSGSGNIQLVGTVTAPVLRLSSTTDAALASTDHGLQIGATNSTNVIIDNNEIMARNNGAVSTLFLNFDGGSVTIGNATTNDSALVMNGVVSVGAQSNKATITYTTNTARTYTLPDAGANADFVMTAGSQTIGGAKTFSNDVTISSRMLMANGTSPNTATMQFGDNTGWVFRMMTNVSGTPTVRYSFTDGGNFTATGNVTAFSDERLKTNIRTIPNALSLVQEMRGVLFDKDGKAGVGVIAQEMENILPEVVHNGEEYKSVAYGNIVGVLIEAIKEQQRRIEDLERRPAV